MGTNGRTGGGSVLQMDQVRSVGVLGEGEGSKCFFPQPAGHRKISEYGHVNPVQLTLPVKLQIL